MAFGLMGRHKRFILCRQFQLFRSDCAAKFSAHPGTYSVNRPTKCVIKAMVNANRFLSTIKSTTEYSGTREELPGDL